METEFKLVWEILDTRLLSLLTVEENIRRKCSVDSNDTIIIKDHGEKCAICITNHFLQDAPSSQLSIVLKFSEILIHTVMPFIEIIKKEIGDYFVEKAVLIYDDASIYLGKDSYPLIAEVESSLRAVVYKILLQHNGAEFRGRLVDILDRIIGNKGNLCNRKGCQLLHEIDLSVLIKLFFGEYFLYDYNELQGDDMLSRMSKNELINLIHETKPISINEKFFDNFSLKMEWFAELRDYRNKVMHFKEIELKEYNNFKRNYEKARDGLNKILAFREGSSLNEVMAPIAEQLLCVMGIMGKQMAMVSENVQDFINGSRNINNAE